MKLLSARHVAELIENVGIERFLRLLRERMREDFSRWSEFDKSPRHATHFDHGVIELMPCADQDWYTFKYVNGHPHNSLAGLPTVVAFGVLAETRHGLPVLIADMTLLTALRTAATAALGASYLARDDSRVLSLLGCGAQAEFQALAIANERPIAEIRYHDIDPAAMDKLARNLAPFAHDLVPCHRVDDLLSGCDILVTATAAKRKTQLFAAAAVPAGLHIHALGGDCPGKTELDPELLRRAKVVVEYLPQSLREGEIQNLAGECVHAELWQLVVGERPGRESNEEITLFDSVGFAVEDYSALRLGHALSAEYGIGQDIDLLCLPDDPKDLFGPLGLS